MSKKSRKRPEKPAPDDTVYLTKSGERVRIAATKQFASHPSDPQWMKELRAKQNKGISIIRISDGHEVWGLTKEDLTVEK